MNPIVDFFPILLFFIAYKFGDIYLATGVAMVGALLQIAYAKFVLKRISVMLRVSLFVILVFGGLTLILHNPTFIKWKPTVLYWCMAATLGGSAWFFKRNLLTKVLSEQQINLPAPVWNTLNTAWVVFFTCMGALNLYIAFNYPEATWVNFKAIWMTVIFVLFGIGQAVFLARYIKDEPEAEGTATPAALPDIKESKAPEA